MMIAEMMLRKPSILILIILCLPPVLVRFPMIWMSVHCKTAAWTSLIVKVMTNHGHVQNSCGKRLHTIVISVLGKPGCFLIKKQGLRNSAIKTNMLLKINNAYFCQESAVLRFSTYQLSCKDLHTFTAIAKHPFSNTEQTFIFKPISIQITRYVFYINFTAAEIPRDSFLV